MVWYGKYEKEEKSSKNKKKKNDEVRLTARYLNSDDDSEIIHDNWNDEEISLTSMRGRDD